MVIREKYAKTEQTTVKLNPNINPDALIIDAMGWGPGGISMGKVPILPVKGPGSRVPVVHK